MPRPRQLQRSTRGHSGGSAGHGARRYPSSGVGKSDLRRLVGKCLVATCPGDEPCTLEPAQVECGTPVRSRNSRRARPGTWLGWAPSIHAMHLNATKSVRWPSAELRPVTVVCSTSTLASPPAQTRLSLGSPTPCVQILSILVCRLAYRRGAHQCRRMPISHLGLERSKGLKVLGEAIGDELFCATLIRNAKRKAIAVLERLVGLQDVEAGCSVLVRARETGHTRRRHVGEGAVARIAGLGLQGLARHSPATFEPSCMTTAGLKRATSRPFAQPRAQTGRDGFAKRRE